MFQELAKLFSGKDANDRRSHERKAVQYPARWVKDAASESYAEGVGLEISPTGALFALKEKPPGRRILAAVQASRKADHVAR